MNWLRNIIRRFWWSLYHWVVPPYGTIIVEETLPDRLKGRTLYIVEEDGFQEQAAMICPCGCKRILHMNLIPDERPCWRLTRHEDGTSTLQPSVWRKKDCGSHFWFRRGRVQWCRMTG
ncbi:MAG TPA: hypothetical protein ENI69_06215 [Rhodospirillales bacterium]|nr:hypothetical protein [Rhodospirillales bacterium]